MTIKMSGLISNLDTDSIVQQLVSAYNVKIEAVEAKKTKLEWKEDAWSTLNTSIYSFYTDKLSDMRLTDTYSSKSTSISDTSVATITASNSAVNGTQTLSVTNMATSGYLTGAKLSSTGTLSSSSTLADLGFTSSETFTVAIGSGTSSTSSSFAVDSNTTISSLVTKLKSAGLNASFDSTNGRIFVNSSDSGAASDFTLSSSNTTSTSALVGFGLSTDSALTTNTAVKVDGKDATIKLNGATYTSDSNTFTINGVTLAIKSTTTSDAYITTDTDYQGIYDKIKSFMSSYNTLITSMDTSYYADSAKGYEPLTDDEKSAMSDTEVENWETKIKDALLRKDSTLGDLTSSMKNSMSSIVTIDGTKYSLSTYGIDTENYFTAADTERGVYHIDGNSDDEQTADNEDKLMTAIMADPDKVISFFTSLSKTVYNNLTTSMKSNSLRSTYTVYNDKEMDSQVTDYEDEIDTLTDKMNAMEDKYYSQFTAMEVALAKLQSNSSALSSLTSS